MSHWYSLCGHPKGELAAKVLETRARIIAGRAPKVSCKFCISHMRKSKEGLEFIATPIKMRDIEL